MRKVLVADDTKNIRTLLKTCLEIEGYSVTLAIDGNQALGLMQQHTYDLAFIDIKMPEMTGTEVLRRIRETGDTTPVIIMTAYGTIKNAVECTRLGAVTYLQKPFTADKIKSLLTELLKNDRVNTIPADPPKSMKLFGKGSGADTADVLDKAEALIASSDFSRALELLKSSMTIVLENPRVYYLLSCTYSGLGDVENSEKFKRMYEAVKQERI